MSNVLYDEPGPKARRRAAIGTVVAAAILLGFTGVAVWRLADRGQFDAELWSPLINPSDENFVLVWRLLAQGLQATLTAAVLAISLSLVIGTLLGVSRLMLGKVGRIPVVAVIELFRGLPVIISIFYVYILVRSTGIDISFLPGSDGLWFLVIGLTFYNSVIIAEIVRAGVNSLPRGQSEAALAIGMTRWKSMKNVELPQAFRTMLPALISQLVVVLKDTSLVAVLGLYTELLRRGNLISLNLDNPIQVLFVVGLIFILINYGLSKLAEFVERRLSTRGQSSTVLVKTGDAVA
ncbi:amino acid ABC transporter permease [Nocardioides eburneiflavus]|uniref:Amino acid ABC transporter permease n=1 Tax=Nocardioides eburneiflavus TaxID=2518372 RepID=A0A4Z1CM90_9ACTN|nr:amino acid ABC transporter permease [Nocardioides eburneiflavus]TGN63839.1 amino acid ABC transporter permease [Nocardioides eburneiflavus]